MDTDRQTLTEKYHQMYNEDSPLYSAIKDVSDAKPESEIEQWHGNPDEIMYLDELRANRDAYEDLVSAIKRGYRFETINLEDGVALVPIT